jgi:hypothetical protein
MQMAASLKIVTADPKSLATDIEKRIEAIEKDASGLANLFAQPSDRFQVGVAEAMLFANNEALQKSLLDGPNALPAILAKEADATQRAELAVRIVLGRPARAEEVEALVSYMQRRQDRPDAASQQVVWALLTSAEFRFNH